MSRVISVENLSKQYRLGEIGTGTISHDLNRFWAKIRGKDDPFSMIGESNDRSTKGESDYVWALKDINFDIEQGDAVGIIGRNGAGKSTLLKILSRTTLPTTGSLKIKGRIASLLEVGTGFHPEMTGRENIYQNGALLGMRKHEITRKFDEIVAFSGCERYIDTPVKRYSSGMYVRLAFAVAAHLESEILIVDEVLAVGDAEFQKKCLGKMNDVSKGEGRTILFVSHNMSAIQNLCDKGIYLENGKTKFSGGIEDAINIYLKNNISNNVLLSEITNRNGNKDLLFLNGKVYSDNNLESFKDLKIELEYRLNTDKKILQYKIDIGINNYLGERLAWLSTDVIENNININQDNKVTFTISNLPLSPGDYNCNLYCEINNEIADWISDVLPFTIIEKDYYKTGKLIPKNQGDILLNFKIN